jgi:pimeloyl-ACP methyl ester carboxylesterase
MTLAQLRIPTQVGTLAVRVRGEGPVAVLWHSLFLDDQSWRRVEDDLARLRRLVIITGPGHGASSDPGQRYSLDDCAAAACQLLDVLGIGEPVDWVGNAWGGHVGIVFAATWPERCRSVVTFGTPVEPYGRSQQIQFRAMLALYRAVGMVDYLSTNITDVLLAPATRARDHEAVALVRDGLRRMGRRELTNAMLSISLGRPDLTPRLAAIRCPTLFVTGSDHPEWTPDQAEAKGRLLPAGSVAVIPDTAYLTPLEAPEATIRLLRAMWADQRSGSPASGSRASAAELLQ